MKRPTTTTTLATRAGFASRAGKVRAWLRARRGVAAVLAMMFIILFGSLSAAMAIAARGNIITAATHLHVNRAQGAAETGLSVGKARLAEAAARFIVSKSDVNQAFGQALWSGSLSSLGNYQVLPPKTGRQDLSAPANLVNALAQAHTLDQDIVTSLGISQPTIGNAIAGSSSDYAGANWLYTPAVALEPRAQGQSDPPLAYQITYAPLANGTDIRIIATGYDFGYSRDGQPVTRTIMQDFRMAKSVKNAIVSSARVMVGRNVIVNGDIGTRYTATNFTHGDPLVVKSDFYGLDPVLDHKLNDFYAALATYDVDGDNRLRVGHPVEGAGIPSGQTDYDGDGHPDNAFADATGDGYVDDFDIFIKHFDKNGDNKVTLSHALTDGTPAQGMTPEFVDSGGHAINDDLALLIDSNNPDRNRNGVYGFIDTNGNGRWDAGELMLDVDTADGSYADQTLGYRDGFIDKKDQYAKIKGGLKFKVTQSNWSTNQGAIQPKLQGPIVPPSGTPTQAYGLGDTDLPDVSGSIFDSSRNDLQALADGSSFDNQVATQLGVSTTQLATYSAARPSDQSAPWFRRVDPNADATSLPANAATAYWERMPYNSPSYSDVFYRPVYYNMTFKNVQIPMGNNGLFVNCTFVGVTYVRTDTADTHPLWGEYGRLTVTNGAPALVNPRFIYGGTNYPTMLPNTAIPPQQNILMAVTPLDKADLDSTQTTRPGYSTLPNPLVINGKRVTDTKTRSNNIRFHDCLFVGSIVSDAPTTYYQTRNKIQFTGATRFSLTHPTQPNNAALNPDSDEVAQIKKSSMMLPGYSVDLGTFNSPTDQNIQLQGAVIAGDLDARGNVNLDGSLLLTFNPNYGSAPLADVTGAPVGNPAGFNATLGYFGSADGDAESIDPSTLPIVNGQRIAGWDTNGDGLADVSADQPQPPGSTAIPFNGFGRISINFKSDLTLPDGIMLPMSVNPIASSYREGHP
ncbi:MAG: hypothetical protein GC200_10580 [Tepidisphaera sp.]|nr:hypothetical protein [Tepidisphaera sp.]